MKKHIIFLFIVFCIINGLAAQDENSDALYLKQKKEFVLNTDGSMDYNYSHQLKLITYLSSDKQFGESFIVFNPTYQQLSIHRSTTTMASGRKVKSPENAFNEVLPQFAPNAPAFNNLREMVVTHTGIEPGATIDLSYTVHSKKDFLPAMMGNELLPGTAPVKELTIVVKIPIAQTLSFQLFNTKATPVAMSDGVYKTYTWKFTNMKALSHEIFQSRDNRLLPRISFVVGKQIVEKITAQPAFKLEANDAMKAAVSKIKANEKDPLKIALGLQELVVGELTTIPVPPICTGFRFRTPIEVWNSNYGSEPEKALLLSALLKQAGINNNVSAANFKGLQDGEVTNPLIFSDYYVTTDFGRAGKFTLSPVRFNEQDPLVSQPYRKVSLLIPGKAINAGSIDQEKNQLSLNGKLILDGKGKVSGSCNATWKGILHPYYRIRKNEKAVAGLFTDGFVNQDIKVYAIKENKPLTLNVDYTIEKGDALHETSGLLYLALPQQLGDAGNWGFTELPSIRTENLELPAEIDQEYNLSITLPNTYTLLTPEIKKTMKNGAGNVEILIKKEGQAIVIIRNLSLNSLVLKPEQVSDLKALMNLWLNKNYKQLILKKI
jgi:hypothetical protein